MTAAAASIHVCPLSRLPATLAASGAGSVVTLMARDGPAALPPLHEFRHLVLDLADIAAPLGRHTLPGKGHIADLLAFVTAWDRRAPLLIHCYAGVSRSTAAAFATLAALCPGIGEAELASRLRSASPSATPNARIVALADVALGRTGRMVDAIQAIGRGRDCFEGEVFHLDLPA